MSDRTFAWTVVYLALLVGWFSRVLAEFDLDPLPLILAAVGGALLIVLVERRLVRKDRP
jgi:hypothetical protein